MKRQILSLTILVLLASCGEESPARHFEKNKDIDPLNNEKAYIYLNSGIHHDKLADGTSTLSYMREKNAKGVIELPFRKEAQIEHSDLLIGTPNNRPTLECGADISFKTITEYTTDCKAKNSDSAQKLGHEFGNSAEGNWSLVVKTSNKKEIWIDHRTQMLWSADLGVANDWCQASGNTQNVTGAINCSDSKYNELDINLCDDTDANYKEAKGNLGNKVDWRLPTRSDWLMADINGLKFVLDEKTSISYWSATGSARAAEKAWLYNTFTGEILTNERKENIYSVRCIGTFK